MPTENRSSNTEMVSVPRELAESIVRMLQGSGGWKTAEQLSAILAQPAEQHQGEPVALPEREHYTKYLPGVIPSNAAEVNARKDGWNACLDEIAKLGPLYTHADPGEVERLTEQLEIANQAIAYAAQQSQEKQKVTDALMADAKQFRAERDTLRAQLAEAHALLADAQLSVYSDCGDAENPERAKYAVELAERIDAALSASAEPEVPQVESEKPGRCTSCDDCQGFNTGHDSSQQKPYSIRCDNCHKEARASDHAGLARAWNAINQGE